MARRRRLAVMGRNRTRYEPLGVVAAADGAWIRTSFEMEYAPFAASIEEPGRRLGYLFLDKRFQLSVKVPSVGPGQLDPYLAGLLRGRPERESEEVRERVKRLRARLRRSRSDADVVEASREDPDARVRRAVAVEAVEQLTSPAVQQATEHALQKFTPFVEPNPADRPAGVERRRRPADRDRARPDDITAAPSVTTSRRTGTARLLTSGERIHSSTSAAPARSVRSCPVAATVRSARSARGVSSTAAKFSSPSRSDTWRAPQERETTVTVAWSRGN